MCGAQERSTQIKVVVRQRTIFSRIICRRSVVSNAGQIQNPRHKKDDPQRPERFEVDSNTRTKVSETPLWCAPGWIQLALRKARRSFSMAFRRSCLLPLRQNEVLKIVPRLFQGAVLTKSFDMFRQEAGDMSSPQSAPRRFSSEFPIEWASIRRSLPDCILEPKCFTWSLP